MSHYVYRYHRDLAPKGQMFTSEQVTAGLDVGWVDTPTKFGKEADYVEPYQQIVPEPEEEPEEVLAPLPVPTEPPAPEPKEAVAPSPQDFQTVDSYITAHEAAVGQESTRGRKLLVENYVQQRHGADIDRRKALDELLVQARALDEAEVFD